ncbi:hypothetical protein FS749_007073, partial [Ceratobasidium sp. UAMH 11750]
PQSIVVAIVPPLPERPHSGHKRGENTWTGVFTSSLMGTSQLTPPSPLCATRLPCGHMDCASQSPISKVACPRQHQQQGPCSTHSVCDSPTPAKALCDVSGMVSSFTPNTNDIRRDLNSTGSNCVSLKSSDTMKSALISLLNRHQLPGPLRGASLMTHLSSSSLTYYIRKLCCARWSLIGWLTHNLPILAEGNIHLFQLAYSIPSPLPPSLNF